MSSFMSKLQRDALQIYFKALKAVECETLVERSIKFKNGKFIVEHPNINGNYKKTENVCIDLNNTTVHIIGGGKSVLPMACSLLKQIEFSSELNAGSINGYLSLPTSTNDNPSLKNVPTTEDESIKNLLRKFNINYNHGALNNLPDENSLYATKNIIKLIDKTCHKSKEEKNFTKPLFIVLISGGGSACLTFPKYVGLEEKLSIIKALVANGSDIKQLNTVRRFLSEVKGGKLAARILKKSKDAQVVTLILSDVIGDPIKFIASGPTYIESHAGDSKSISGIDSLSDSALRILNDLNVHLEPDVIAFSNDEIYTESIRRVHNFIIGNNILALDAATNHARCLGYEIEYLGNSMHGDIDLVLSELFTKLKCSTKRIDDEIYNKVCIIGGGEATVNLKNETNVDKPAGKGGRAQEMALKYLHRKFEQGVIDGIDDLFLAAGTDGQDGPTQYAGCLSSWSMWSDFDCEKIKADIESHLEQHDSTNFWTKYKNEWLIKTGLTGTNVMDIYMVLLAKQRAN